MKYFIFIFTILLSGSCDIKNSTLFITKTNIGDILAHPRNYNEKIISIKGRVVNSSALFQYSGFTVEDGTGSIFVCSDKISPNIHEIVVVRGVVDIPFRWDKDAVVIFIEK